MAIKSRFRMYSKLIIDKFKSLISNLDNQTSKAFACLVLLTISGTAGAIPITLSDFDATAKVFDFTGVSLGDTTVVTTDLTVTGGVVSYISIGSLVAPTYTNNFTPYTGFRIDFNDFVSKVGMDVHLNQTAVVLGLYDASDNLLDSYKWEYVALGGTPAFIGLDSGLGLVSYALVDTPDSTGHDMFMDNIIYESAISVPEPSIIWLLGSGLALIGFTRRKA